MNCVRALLYKSDKMLMAFSGLEILPFAHLIIVAQNLSELTEYINSWFAPKVPFECFMQLI